MARANAGDSGSFDSADVLLEMLPGDRLGPPDLQVIVDRLGARLGSPRVVVPAVSVLEPSGTMWWFCLYVWCRSALARRNADVLLAEVLAWGRLWRQRDPQERPLYVATVDIAGYLLEARLLRADVELLPVRPSRRPRLEPIRLTP